MSKQELISSAVYLFCNNKVQHCSSASLHKYSQERKTKYHTVRSSVHIYSILWKVVQCVVQLVFFFLILAGFHYMLEPKHLGFFPSFQFMSYVGTLSHVVEPMYMIFLNYFPIDFGNMCHGEIKVQPGLVWEKKSSVTYLEIFQIWYIFCVKHTLSFSMFIIKMSFFEQLYFLISVLRGHENVGHYLWHNSISKYEDGLLRSF